MQNSDSAQSAKDLRNVIKINEAQIQDHLGEMVRSTVEETLNAMLDAEAVIPLSVGNFSAVFVPLEF